MSPPCSTPHPGITSLKKPSPRFPLPQTPVTSAHSQCDGLNCVLSNLHIEVLTTRTSECGLFFLKNRFIADSVKMRSSWNKRGPQCNVTGVLIKNATCRERATRRDAVNVLSVRRAKGCQQTTRSWERGLEQTLTVLRSHQPADTLISQPPGWERMEMCC